MGNSAPTTNINDVTGSEQYTYDAGTILHNQSIKSSDKLDKLFHLEPPKQRDLYAHAMADIIDIHTISARTADDEQFERHCDAIVSELKLYERGRLNLDEIYGCFAYRTFEEGKSYERLSCDFKFIATGRYTYF